MIMLNSLRRAASMSLGAIVAVALLTSASQAQQVQAVMPDAVTRGGDGYLRVHYDRLGLRFLSYKDWLAAGGQIPMRGRM